MAEREPEKQATKSVAICADIVNSADENPLCGPLAGSLKRLRDD